MPSKIVVRVFFPDGLFKTALVDSEISVNRLIAIIGKKLSLEYSANIDLTKCELYECQIDSVEPGVDLKPIWTANPFGTTQVKMNPTDSPFEVVQNWITQKIALRCRFVMDYKLPDGLSPVEHPEIHVPQKEQTQLPPPPGSTPQIQENSSTEISPALTPNKEEENKEEDKKTEHSNTVVTTVAADGANVNESATKEASQDGRIVCSIENIKISVTPVPTQKEGAPAPEKSDPTGKYLEFVNTHRSPEKPAVKSFADLADGVAVLDVLEFVSKTKISVNSCAHRCYPNAFMIASFIAKV